MASASELEILTTGLSRKIGRRFQSCITVKSIAKHHRLIAFADLGCP